MNRFRFVPNVPAFISLATPEGQYDSEAGTVAYQLSDGRELVVNTEFATRINLLDLQPGETFGICQRVSEERRPPNFDVWRTFRSPAGRTAGVAEPAPAARPAQPIPFNDAFTEVVKLVRNGLESVGEQWSDASRQDAVSTILIAGVNRGWIGPWERNQ